MNNLQPVENKALLKSSTFIFLIRFFPTLATLLVMIFFSRALPEGEYGIYQSFWVYQFVFAAVATIGIPVASLSYNAGQLVSLFQWLQRKHWLRYSIFLLLVSIVFTVFQFTQTSIQPLVAALFFISYTLSLLLESVLLIFKKFRRLLWVNLVYSSLFVFAHVVVWQQHFSLSHLFACLSLFLFVKCVLLSFTLGVAFKSTETTPSFNTNEVSKHWFNMYLYDLSQMLFKYIDKFILSLFLSSSLFAIYFNGSIDIPFLPILLGAATSAALLHITQADTSVTASKEVATILYTSKVLSCIVFPLFLFLLLFRYELFEVVFTNRYIAAVPIFAWSIVVLPLRCYGFTAILQKRQQGTLINKGAILDLVVAVALMYPMYRWMGLPGVALSFVISTYVQAGYYLFHTARLVQQPLQSLVPLAFWGKQLFLSVVVIGISYFSLMQLGLASWQVLLSGLVIAFVLSGIQLVAAIRKG